MTISTSQSSPPGRRPSTSWTSSSIDCVVLDLRLAGYVRLRRAGTFRDTPCYERFAGGRVHRQGTVAGGRCSASQLARSVVVKGVESPERLLDETSLFLHRVVANLPARKAEDARPASSLRRSAGRQESVGRRRRRSQHFRAQQRAGTPRNDRADRRHRPRGD